MPSTKPAAARWLAGFALVWLAAVGAVITFGGSGAFPINVPTSPVWSVTERIAAAHVIALEVGVLAAVVVAITRRHHPTTEQLIARGPSAAVARSELAIAAGYLVFAQALGAILGLLAGWGPLSYHLIGSVHGTHHQVEPVTVIGWMLFNLLAYVVIPGWVLAQRYRPSHLWLRSTDRGRDLRVVAVVLVLESAFQLLVFGSAFFALTGSQIAVGTALSLTVFFLGTVLPTLVVVAVVVVPRVLVITGSQTAAVVVGGLVYAVIHLFDGWTDYSSIQLAGLSLGLLVLQYAVPGMFKAFLTLRTGNAWVHAWAYHAIAPHVWADTPLIVKIFGLR